MNTIDEKLYEHAHNLRQKTLADLFANDPERVLQWTFYPAGIYADISKNHVDAQTKILWQQWLDEAKVAEGIVAITRGDNVNTAEHRPALHHALRAPATTPFLVNGLDVNQEITTVRSRLKTISSQIRHGEWTGFSGASITDVVHIGIGGSELGPRLLCNAFAHLAEGNVRLHFLATTDPIQIQTLQRHLNPATTLLIIASKSFGTEETLANALFMRNWLRQAGGIATDKQMIALTANVDKAKDFGLIVDNILPFWDWVGGRFSLWSAIALPFILQNGYTFYESLLAGAHAMDIHFQTTPLMRNLPVQLALLDAWYNHYFDINNRCVVMYANALRSFPQYLQQLDMESLGKRATQHNQPLTKPSGLILWGGTGTEAQHAFFQLLHQGQRIAPVDFITVKSIPSGYEDAGKILHSHCLAQAAALMSGRDEDHLFNVDPDERYARTCPGNRPSTTLILDDLTPACIGALIALYEHKITVLGLLYGVNAYDQWGVELGKILAQDTKTSLTGNIGAHDASTTALIRHLKS